MNLVNGVDWVPPPLPNLVVRQHDDHWLCLEPTVPAWFVTNRAGALLLKLADGRRTVADIHGLLRREGVRTELEFVEDLFDAARQSMLYSHGSDEVEEWTARKLGAVHLHLTNRCNLECTYCFRESTPRLPIHHTADHFVDALRAMEPFAAEQLAITFTGGEPMMFPGFNAVVEASTELGYKNALLTNGILITPEQAVFIARHFNDITISLDGPTEAIHEVTRGRGNYKRVLTGIRRLADAGANVSVKVTVTPANVEYCGEVVGTVPESVPVAFTPMMPMGRGQEPDREFLDNDAFLGLNRGLARVTEGRLNSSYLPGRRSRRCHAGVSNISIADTGDVYPCHLFHQPDFRLGNIFTQPFDEIFYGDRNHDYVVAMDVEANNDVCRSCEVRFLCGGGCKANALHAGGDFRAVDSYCSYLKSTIVEELFGSCGITLESVTPPMQNPPVLGSGQPRIPTFLGLPAIDPASGAIRPKVQLSSNL